MSTRDGKAYAIDGQPLDLTGVPTGLEYANAYAAADRMAAREDRPITLTVDGQRVATAHPIAEALAYSHRFMNYNTPEVKP